MKTQLCLMAAFVTAGLVSASGTPAWAQASSMPVPTYRSSVSAGTMSDHNFNTPEAEGRPGIRFYIQGMNAYQQGDLTHALNRLKLSAYWAYAPAAYNLGVMYFQGEGGIPMNRPLGTAWMFIAAEQGNAQYIAARHMLVTKLSYSERTQALQDYRRLEQKYGDNVAMHRAKGQWALVKSQQTGSRVGHGVGESQVGIFDPHDRSALYSMMNTPGSGLTQQGSVEGAMAYRQFQQSDDPYSPIFLKQRSGAVDVGPLQQIPSKDSTNKSDQQGDQQPSGGHSLGA